jgi:hypothetical protein
MDPEAKRGGTRWISCLTIAVLAAALVVTTGLLLIRQGADSYHADELRQARDDIARGALAPGAPLPAIQPLWLSERWDDPSHPSILVWKGGGSILVVVAKDGRAYGAYQLTIERGQDDKVFFWQEDECNQVMNALKTTCARSTGPPPPASSP